MSGASTGADLSAQLAQKGLRRGRPEGGLSIVARELGISRDDVRRALKVDSLSHEAKQAAKETGLDKNRTALLWAADFPPAQQAEALRSYNPAQTARKGRAPASLDAWLLALEALWNASPREWRCSREADHLIMAMRGDE